MEELFFDLETQYLFQELGMTNSSRDPSRLRLAVAGTLQGDEAGFYTEEDIRKLFSALDSADLIVGFNLLGFDYPVLQPYAEFDLFSRYAEKTLDMFDVIKKVTGCYLSLNHLCELNTGKKKNEDTLRVPALWRSGRRREVESYLRNDLELTRSLFSHVRREKKLRYEHRSYGKSYGVKEIQVDWDQ